MQSVIPIDLAPSLPALLFSFSNDASLSLSLSLSPPSPPPPYLSYAGLGEEGAEGDDFDLFGEDGNTDNELRLGNSNTAVFDLPDGNDTSVFE